MSSGDTIKKCMQYLHKKAESIDPTAFSLKPIHFRFIFITPNFWYVRIVY